MVKEGHDSTVRPVLKTWEFDQDTGRRIFDEWVRALRMHARIDACVSLLGLAAFAAAIPPPLTAPDIRIHTTLLLLSFRAQAADGKPTLNSVIQKRIRMQPPAASAVCRETSLTKPPYGL